MAQTNDETFLKKGLSKTNYEIISELGFRADYDGEIRIALNKARLATLDDCKTLLERVLSERRFPLKEAGMSEFNIQAMRDNAIQYNFVQKALAELEAMKEPLGKVEAEDKWTGEE